MMGGRDMWGLEIDPNKLLPKLMAIVQRRPGRGRRVTPRPVGISGGKNMSGVARALTKVFQAKSQSGMCFAICYCDVAAEKRTGLAIETTILPQLTTSALGQTALKYHEGDA